MTGLPGTLADALVAVHQVLTRGGVDHALCGGLAANLYRDDVRATSDVDVYVVVNAPQFVELARSFEAAGWRAHPAWHMAELLRLSRDDLPRIDCVIATTDFEREAVRHATPASIAGREIKVLTPEDLIVVKLVAGRARDYEAVAAILNARSVDVDTDYVQRWLQRLELSERWDRAVAEAELEAGDLG